MFAVIQRQDVAPLSGKYFKFKHKTKGYEFGIMTWVSYCCALNALQNINYHTLNEHHEEIFKWLQNFNDNLKSEGQDTILYPPKTFIYTNNAAFDVYIPAFRNHPFVKEIHSFPNLAHGFHDVKMYLITLEDK